MRFLSFFLIGAIFGIGIVTSGMGDPAKVQNFFDLFGNWDPSLAFVMGGALLVFMPGYFFLVRPRRAPVLDGTFRLPQRKEVDAPLVGGAAVFGIGWGIVGFCPGGAIPMVATLDGRVFLFLAAMASGILIARFGAGLLSDRQRAAAEVSASG
jgi:uncharacterized protein